MHKLGVYVFSFLLIGFLSVESSIAATYEPGHQALQLWNEEAMKNVPQWLNIWLSIMVGAFALGLLFVWRHVAARWLVGGFILMVLFVFFIGSVLELTPLSGLFALLHIIFWMPGFLILLKERPFLNGFSFYGVWAGLITVVILISFVFDFPNAAIYLDHVLGLGLLV